MAQNTGMYNLDDLRAARFSSAAEFGLDTINEILQRDLANFNAQMTDQLTLLADPLTVQSRIYGTSAAQAMVEMDEFGAAPSRKQLPGETVSFPLRLYAQTLGWTSKSLQIADSAEIVEKFLQLRTGYSNEVIKQVRLSMYNDTNYSFIDVLTDGITLAVKRFLNADSQRIPDSPAGAEFDADTHTHYLASATGTVSNADIDTLVNHVTEHGNTRGIKLVIHMDNKAAISLLTGFEALGDAGIIYNASDTTLKKANFGDLENQLIGYWRTSSVEVWVKPWAVANYPLCVATEGVEKPLGYRQREQASLRGFRIDAKVNDYPLIAEFTEAEFGFGVWNRTAGAIMFITDTTYANPSL